MRRRRPYTLSKPSSCRFSPETKKRLDNVARCFHLRPSEIIRRAVEHQQAAWDQAGRIILTKREETDP